MNRAERAKGPQKTEKSLTPEEERMLLENRISAVLSRLSETEPGTPDYQALDEEFRELTAKRKSFLL